MKPVPSKTQSFTRCEEDKVCVQHGLPLRGTCFFSRLCTSMHIYSCMYTHKHSFMLRHTQTHVYSTHNPQRFCVINSAEHQIAHCDK